MIPCVPAIPDGNSTSRAISSRSSSFFSLAGRREILVRASLSHGYTYGINDRIFTVRRRIRCARARVRLSEFSRVNPLIRKSYASRRAPPNHLGMPSAFSVWRGTCAPSLIEIEINGRQWRAYIMYIQERLRKVAPLFLFFVSCFFCSPTILGFRSRYNSCFSVNGVEIHYD